MTPQKTHSTFNPWPWALIAFFAVFISLIVAFVVFSLRQDMQLVRPDYYEEEVKYQDQIDRMQRTLPVQNEVRVAYDDGGQCIDIRLPARHAALKAHGRIQFYRPSDAALDHELALQLDANGRQQVPTSGLATGLWNLRVYWEVEGQEYFTRQAVIIAPGKS